MTKIIENKTIVFIARIFIAGIFIWFAIDKIITPREFVANIGDYSLVPNNLLNLTAIIMPAFELVIGLVLLLGLFTRAASLSMLGLMIMFLSAFLITRLFGIEIFDCGCGGLEIPPHPAYIITRDAIFILASYLAFKGKHILALDNIIFRK